MEKFIRNYNDGYKYLFEDLVSPITKNWFMVGSPIKVLTLVGIYLLFSLKLGPWLMKNRKPYSLRNSIKVYNIFQIFISIYLFYEGLVYIFSNDFNFCCQGLHDTNIPAARRIANNAWIFYMVKIIDLLDTVFFVLRKSFRQISSLHVHHHSIMPIIVWFGVTYYPGGQAAIMAIINTFVHAVMYTYYLLAGLGDQYKKYLWWKKYLTTLQLVQFVIVAAHSINSLFYECSYPMALKILTFTYAMVFIHMFGQFYYAAYIKNTNFKESKTRTRNGIKKE